MTEARIPRALLVVLALLTAMQTARAVRVAGKQATDYLIFHDAAGLAVSGGDPYAARVARYPYIYPPLLLCLVEPLTWLGYRGGVAVWALINSAAWVGLVFGAIRLCWPEDRAPPGWVSWAVALLPYRWVLNFMLHGQVDMLVCACLVGSFALARRGRDVAAGFALACAVVLKLLPAAFFGFYLLRGRWRVVAAGAAFAGLLFVAPVARYGPARFLELLQQWRAGPLLGEIGDPSSDAQESNQGLAAAIYRYALPRPLMPPEHQAPALVHWSTATVVRVYACGAALILAAYAAALVASRRRADADALAFALTFVVLHVVSRRSWGYHYVTMTFVYAALLGGAARASWSEAVRGPLREAVVAAAVLQNFYSPLLWGKRISAELSAWAPTTLSFLVLVGCLTTALLRLGRERGAEPSIVGAGEPD